MDELAARAGVSAPPCTGCSAASSTCWGAGLQPPPKVRGRVLDVALG